MTMHNKRQAILEERKPKPVNYAAKFRIFSLFNMEYGENYEGQNTTATGPDGALYVSSTTPCKRNIPFYIVIYYIKGYISLAPSSTYLVHLNINIIDPLIVQLAIVV
jgi:hypothetical protein